MPYSEEEDPISWELEKPEKCEVFDTCQNLSTLMCPTCYNVFCMDHGAMFARSCSECIDENVAAETTVLLQQKLAEKITEQLEITKSAKTSQTYTHPNPIPKKYTAKELEDEVSKLRKMLEDPTATIPTKQQYLSNFTQQEKELMYAQTYGTKIQAKPGNVKKKSPKKGWLAKKNR